ncbi:hypothetical protein BH09PAT1_BH09PAT1_8870 [soil metagenome]
MVVNLTKVRARINNIKKKIYYDKSIQNLKLYNVNDLVLELSTDWFMGTFPTSNLATGAEYFELYIADAPDNIDLNEIIPDVTTVEVDGERYRIMQYFKPRIATKQWYLRVETTGETA